MWLKLPVAATSLVPGRRDGMVSKFTREALEELVALAEESGVAPCSSDPTASGSACPAPSSTRLPATSRLSSRR